MNDYTAILSYRKHAIKSLRNNSIDALQTLSIRRSNPNLNNFWRASSWRPLLFRFHRSTRYDNSCWKCSIKLWWKSIKKTSGYYILCVESVYSNFRCIVCLYWLVGTVCLFSIWHEFCSIFGMIRTKTTRKIKRLVCFGTLI